MQAAQRLSSVDALRGLTVAAMLLVNNPGDWGHVYAPLLHADWHGCTPTDLIFPFFLFIVGVSLALALGPRLDAGAAPGPLLRSALWRAARIMALGLALHWLAWWLMDKPEFRMMGVLQRIALCFGLAALLRCCWRSARLQWALLLVLLLGYGGLLLAGGDLGKAGNIAARLDTQLLGRYAYEWDAASGRAHEPEGLLSTLGALASTLLGLRAGELLRRSARRELAWLAAGCLLLGALSAAWLPWNKQLWTPSFVLWTGGWATSALLLAHQLVDRWSWRPLGRAFGVNAIAAYAGAWVSAVLLAGLDWMAPLYVHGFGWLLPLVGPRATSLAFALVFVALWALVVRWMDRRGLYIKV